VRVFTFGIPRAEAANLLGHLFSEFAGRAHNQRLGVILRLVESIQKAYRKRCSFAAAGFGLCDEISTFDKRRETLGLNRRHGAVA
jgi:hypothetical protein